MPSKRILILAGTTEARLLADHLSDAGMDVISSFAGVTRQPILPRGEIRSGGFGGIAGLADYLTAKHITHVIDATHPFALQMSNNIFAATQRCGQSLLRLERPAWPEQAEDRWLHAKDMIEAISFIPRNAKAMITTGRKQLERLFKRDDLSGFIRTIEEPAESMPRGWQILLDRPPYVLDQELSLLRECAVTCLVSKNAGGDGAAAKLAAARMLGIVVVMIQRPEKPRCKQVASCEEAISWANDMPLES